MRKLTAITAILLANAAQAQTLSTFTENVLTHVAIHEIGHALIREFDLPVLGNEEIAADAFATTYIVQNMPDQALDIITARAQSWESEMDEETIFSEYPDDIWRAGQMICLAYGLDPNTFETLARDGGITGDEAAACRERAPEISRSWRRIISPLRLPDGALVNEVFFPIGEGPWETAVRDSTLHNQLQQVLSSFDWHSQIALHFDHCEGGAGWSRNGRTILICDDLIERFETQNPEQ